MINHVLMKRFWPLVHCIKLFELLPSTFSTSFRIRPYPSILSYQKRAQQHDLDILTSSSYIDDLKNVRIEISLEDIKKISKNQFSQIIKKAIQERALEYLVDKQGSKGQELSCKELKMADYLLPSNQNISLDEQRSIFAIRNRMVIIPSNFPIGKEVEICPCGQIENMKHIY